MRPSGKPCLPTLHRAVICPAVSRKTCCSAAYQLISLQQADNLKMQEQQERSKRLQRGLSGRKDCDHYNCKRQKKFQPPRGFTSPWGWSPHLAVLTCSEAYSFWNTTCSCWEQASTQFLPPDINIHNVPVVTSISGAMTQTHDHDSAAVANVFICWTWKHPQGI